MKNLVKKIITIAVVSVITIVMGLSVLPTVTKAEEPDITAPKTYKDVDPKNWMHYLPDGLPINQINIPGTHDSGTAHVWGGSLGYISCQDLQIDTQLERGLRCFDIRVDIPGGGEKSDTWKSLYLYHGPFVCTKYITHFPRLDLNDVVEYCKDFLKKHPDETIILKLQRENKDNEVIRIFKDMYEEFKYTKNRQIRYYHNGDPIPTLGDVRGCIVMIDNNVTGTYTKYEDHYEEFWISNKIDYVLGALNDSAKQNFNQEGAVFKEESYCNEPGKKGEPVVKCIFTNINAVADYAILAPTIITSAQFINYDLQKYDYKKGVRYGWIFMDFPYMYSDIITKIIASNDIPNCNLYFDVVWEDGMTHGDDFTFFIRDDYSNDVYSYDSKWWKTNDEIVVENLPTFKGYTQCEYSMVIQNLPNGYTYRETFDEIDADGNRHYTITIIPPNTTHVRINWNLVAGHPDGEEELTFNAYETTIPYGYFKMNKKVMKTTYVDFEDNSSYYNLMIAAPAYKMNNNVEIKIPDGADYTYSKEDDVVRIDDYNFEITLHSVEPYTSLAGTITFNDNESTKAKRPKTDDFVFNNIKIIGTVDGEVVAEGYAKPDFAKYDSDGVVAWKIDDAPKYSDGKEIEWSVEYYDIKNYKKETDGLNVIYTPVTLLASAEPEYYLIVVADGDADYVEALPGTDIDLKAKVAPDGMMFDKWEIVDGDGVEFDDETNCFASFIMPENDVVLRATYCDIEDKEYSITVDEGLADVEKALPGTEITCTANPAIDGEEFVEWDVIYGEVEFADASAETTTFTMPESEVAIEAVFRVIEDETGVYKVTKGNGQNYVPQSGKTLTFTCDGVLEKMNHLYIDGEEISAESFDCESGSTILTLSNDYLETLDEGDHTIQFSYEDGKSNVADFTVGNGVPTGDEGHAFIWLAIFISVSAILIAGIVLLKRSFFKDF